MAEQLSSRTKRGNRLRVAALVFVVVIVLPLLVNLVSVQPGAMIVKSIFESSPVVQTGPGFAEAAADVIITRDIAILTEDAPTASIDVYQPKQPPAAALPIIMWVHGGGFISGSKEQVGDYAIMLAHEGYIVASLDYTLAPSAQYPTPIRQGNAALQYLSDHAATWGGDVTRIFVGGDSAGSHIASSLAALQTNPALASALGLTPAIPAEYLRGALLFCGLYNMSTVGSTGFPFIRTFLWSYTGYRDWMAFPQIDQLSTTLQVTSAFPPTFLTVGDADPFQSQAFELETVLRQYGVDVTTQYWNDTGAGLNHEYQFNFTLPEANTTFSETLAFLAKYAES